MAIPQDIIDYLDLIDAKFREAKRLGVSRLNPFWGNWSREMNIEINEKKKSNRHSHPELLHMVTLYWTKVSALLELHSRSKLYGQNKKHKLAKEIIKIRNNIITNHI